MNDFIPSIDQLLSLIDPNNTLDKERVIEDTTSVAIINSLVEFTTVVDDPLKTTISEALKEETTNPENIFKMITEANKMEAFLEILNKNIEAVKYDYIKTQVSALTTEKKKDLFEKYPALAQL